MRMNVKAAMLAFTAAALLPAVVPPAQAADTAVTCRRPFATMNTGQDGTPPRFTIHCDGGSSTGGVTFFAYRISDNPAIAQLLSQAFETYITRFASIAPGTAIGLSSDSSDTSGDAWGCGAGNCRIIDYGFDIPAK